MRPGQTRSQGRRSCRQFFSHAFCTDPDGGLLDLEYVGHGVHYSAVRLVEDADADVENPAAASCQLSCDGSSPDESCWCDHQCAETGDCCEDYGLYCTVG